MGFSDADIRASHTIRIFGTNEAGEVLSDIWLDIERIDIFRITAQLDGHFQGIYRRLYWLDDPASGDYNENGNPARSEGLKKFCSPDEEDQENPTEWIPVRTIIEMAWNESSDDNQWKARRGNRTSADNLVRAVAARRCFHRDTTIDADAQAAGDAGVAAYVVASDQYDFLADSDDKGQYIEVQYVSWTMDLSSNKQDQGKNQGVQFSLKNIHYLNFTDPAEGPVNPEHGFDPPWALDPFQAVVNCQFAPAQEAMIAWGQNSKNTKDGIDYQPGFDSNPMFAASGLGFTVTSLSMIVFGKPRDGAACFMAIDGSNIKRGVLNIAADGIDWSVVLTVAESLDAISFAGKAFFVASNDVDATSFLYTSFDGMAWSRATVANNPNGGENGEAGHPVGASVAYNPETKVYCHTGSFTRAYTAFYVDIDDGTTTESATSCTNFWSAISATGTGWAATYDMNTPNGGDGGPSWSGGIGSPSNLRNSVAFGNGVFVAGTTWIERYDYFNFAGAINVLRHVYTRIDVAGIAVSTNGASWSNRQLPGAAWDPGEFHGSLLPASDNNRTALQGFVNGLIFCKAATGIINPETNKNYEGFFVLSANEESSGSAGGHSVYKKFNKKRWKSFDGSSWELVYNDSRSGDLPFDPGDGREQRDIAWSIHNRKHGKIVSN